MKIRKSEMIIFGITLLFFVIGVWLYPQMPEQMAIHWNIRGEVDGYISRFWGVFLFAFIFVGLALFFVVIPRIDPLKANIEKFRGYYDGFVILFSIFWLSTYLHVALWNLGVKVNPMILFPIGIGFLFFYVGILCENAKRNWFIGIRTPWTLSSDKVWEKTHRIGGKMFKIAGVVALLGAIFQDYAFLLILAPAILVIAYTFTYSYFEYQREVNAIQRDVAENKTSSTSPCKTKSCS